MKKFFTVILWLLALCVCLLLADRLMQKDDSARKFGPFFAEKQDIDVFFMGTSRVLDGISPMELWRDTGIPSYNMGSSSESLDMTEWVLRLAMQKHMPKVAVIDVFYVDHALDEAWAYAYRHQFLDQVPLSLAKWEAVRATLPKDQWLEFMMPFSLYHGRWEELLSGQTERALDCEPFMMGSELRLATTPCTDFVRTNEATDSDLPGHDALRRIVALCRENRIEPVLIAIPAPANEQKQRDMNSVTRIAEELHVPFLNLFDVPNLVDFETDIYDAVGHYNPRGASKLTAYLGTWLSEHYDLPDRRGDAAYIHWDERLDAYTQFRHAMWAD